MNPHASAAEAYLTSSIENAPPIKIVRMLYQGALRFLAQAAREDPSDPASRFIELCSGADAIVVELRLALDPEADDGPVVEPLRDLYAFCERELQTAMLERDAAPLAAVERVLGTLLEAWEQVEVDATSAS
ncbi:MAG: flagellar export chaperone FliS [Planctomycetota bacterium]